MAYYLLQVAYTSEAWAAMVKNPHSRLELMRPVLEQLGGKLEGGWLAFGEYDAVLLCQMPDNVSAAAFAMAASAEGAVKVIKTTPMMTLEESLQALKKASASAYAPPKRAASEATLPALRLKGVGYKKILATSYQKFKQKMGRMVTGLGL